MPAIVNISIDLTAPSLTDTEKAVLAALGLTPGGSRPPAPITIPSLKVEEVGRRAELLEDAAPEEMPAPKARAPRKSRAKKADEPAETGGPAALEDLPTATRSEAIEWAIKLSDKGLKDELRGILDTLGAERASTIEDGQQAVDFIMLTKKVLASQPAQEAPVEEAPVEESPVEEAPAAAPSGRTLQDAIDAAMDLVKTGKQAKVRAAVEKLGIAKVSAMSEEQVPGFFALIEA